MTWQDKIKYLIESVLNEGVKDSDRYTVTINNHVELTVYRYDKEEITFTKHDDYLYANWRLYCKEVINEIIESRFRKYIQGL